MDVHGHVGPARRREFTIWDIVAARTIVIYLLPDLILLGSTFFTAISRFYGDINDIPAKNTPLNKFLTLIGGGILM